MTFQITYLSSDDVLVIKTNGKMTGKGFVAMAEAILRHSQWSRGKSGIFDHQALDFEGVAIEDLEKIRAFHKSHDDTIGPGKSAIVVGPGRAAQWEKLWSQGQKIQKQNTVKIFEDFKAAVNWVKVSP